MMLAHYTLAATTLLGLSPTSVQEPRLPDRRAAAADDAIQTRQLSIRAIDQAGESAQPRIRYQFVAPVEPGAHPDMVVLCHGTGLDHRWGLANHPTIGASRFRPDDIVVSIDGPTIAEDGSRLFLGREQDAAAFASCLAELREEFHPARIFLYGHSQGSFFVSYFAGAYPGVVDGVVAHASGMWTWTNADALVKARTPVIFMHGTADPVVPYPQSVGGRDHLQTAGHPAAALRRLAGYNHWPNAVRASECIDWLEGMCTNNAAEALDRATRLSQPKPADEYRYRCAPPMGLAWQVLERLSAQEPRAIGAVPAAIGERADELAQAIQARVQAHIAALTDQLGAPEGLTLDEQVPWLGHLLEAREDLRGIPAFETYARRIKLDETIAAHRTAGTALLRTWFDAKQPVRNRFSAAVRGLPNCFLDDRLPSELPSTLEDWYNHAEAHHLSAEDLLAYRVVTRYRNGLKEGRESYDRIWTAADR